MASAETAILNERFEMLEHPRRRSLLYGLQANGGDGDVRSLAADITRWEGGELEREDMAAVDRVEASLHHVHIPKLVDHGMVTYDPQERHLGTNGPKVRELLAGELLQRESDAMLE